MENKIYIGTAYYPEHWPEERWEEDVELMAEANINVVRLAEFGWSVMEPEDGVFDFTLFQRAIELLEKYGIEVVLGTPTMTPPMWMVKKHPDLVVKNADRIPAGRRAYYCNNHPAYRKFTDRIVSRMADVFGTCKTVIAWQIDNEFNAPRCYCDNCTAAFRTWLRSRYGSIASLNDAWGTVFWSQTYTRWSEVETPHNGEMITNNVSKILDFYRFTSDSTVQYQSLQAEILRAKAPGQLLTHNGMGQFDQVNYFTLAKELDFYSWDTYPAVDDDNVNLCMSHDLSRGVKQSNYWVMEQKNGYFNYAPYNLAIEPGLVRLWSYRDIARGANGVVYFRWRSGQFGIEQHPQGLLRHDGTPRRAFYECRQLAQEIAPFSEDLADSNVLADVAMIWSYDQIWSLSTHIQNSQFDYKSHFLEYYRALHKLGITADIVEPTADLSAYHLVIAPSLFVLNNEIADKLNAYVAAGGLLVLTIRSGVRNWSNLTISHPWPGKFRDAAGMRVVEFDSLPTDQENSIRFLDQSYPVRGFLEILSPENCETLARYENKFYRGSSAVTINRFGKGHVVYVGVMGDTSLYADILQHVTREKTRNVREWPEGIEVTYRRSKTRTYMFVLNSTAVTRSVPIYGEWDIVVGPPKATEIHEIEPLGVRVFATQAALRRND